MSYPCEYRNRIMNLRYQSAQGERVMAVIAAYRRDDELERLLEGLFSGGRRPEGAVVVDNAALESTRQVVSKFPKAYYIASDKNIGPGYAWRRGMEAADEQSSKPVSHYLVLDDDVVVRGDALAKLVEVAQEPGVGMVAPLLSDARGQLWGFPEPEDVGLRRIIREVKTPREALERIGGNPQAFCWCTGACVLVSREAVQVVGPHRDDFWMLGEDLEFSMRVASAFRALFTCAVEVPHLPPVSSSMSAEAKQASLRKFHALLTNLGYLSFHSPYSRHMRRYLAGNYRRYFCTEGVHFKTIAAAGRCLWNGVVCGRPAGAQQSQ